MSFSVVYRMHTLGGNLGNRMSPIISRNLCPAFRVSLHLTQGIRCQPTPSVRRLKHCSVLRGLRSKFTNKFVIHLRHEPLLRSAAKQIIVKLLSRFACHKVSFSCAVCFRVSVDGMFRHAISRESRKPAETTAQCPARHQLCFSLDLRVSPVRRVRGCSLCP